MSGCLFITSDQTNFQSRKLRRIVVLIVSKYNPKYYSIVDMIEFVKLENVKITFRTELHYFEI